MQEKNVCVTFCLISVRVIVAQITRSSLVSLDCLLKREVAIEEILQRVTLEIKLIKANELNIASKHPVKIKRWQKGLYETHGRKK